MFTRREQWPGHETARALTRESGLLFDPSKNRLDQHRDVERWIRMAQGEASAPPRTWRSALEHV
jgi:hypothetical protein